MILITKWRKQRDCFHHDRGLSGAAKPAVTWIAFTMSDTGMHKIFLCTHCGKTWTT